MRAWMPWPRWAGKEVREILHDAVDGEGAHPEVACRWARWCAAGGDRGFEQWIQRLREKGRRSDNAAYAYLEALAKARNGSWFKRFVAHNRSWLRESAFTWGTVGYGMAILRWYRQAAAWTADWSQRADAQPWMLVNAAEGYWAIGKGAEAAAISSHAVTLPDSPAHNLHFLLLAADAVIRNDLSSARKHMERVKARKFDADYSFIATLVQGVLEMEAAERPKQAAVFRQVRQRMDHATGRVCGISARTGSAASLSPLPAASRPASRRDFRLAVVRHAVDGVVNPGFFRFWARTASNFLGLSAIFAHFLAVSVIIICMRNSDRGPVPRPRTERIGLRLCCANCTLFPAFARQLRWRAGWVAVIPELA